MLNRHVPLLRLALLRARLARAEAASRPHASRPIASPAWPSPSPARGLATQATEAAAIASSSPTHYQYEFALTPERRLVTIACAPTPTTTTPGAAARPRRPPTPVVVTTSADPERIVIRAPVGGGATWSVALGPHGPEAREIFSDKAAAAAADAAPPTPPPPPLPPLPLELEVPARFCGLDIASGGGDVTVSGAGVQEADVRIVVVEEEAPFAAPAATATAATAAATTATTTTISAEGRLRCGASLELDAGARGAVRAKELSASRLVVRGGAGVSVGRVSALDATLEAGGGLDVGALYGRAARLRLSGGGGGGAGAGAGPATACVGGGPPLVLPVMRVTQLACEVDGSDGVEEGEEGGATLEAWPPGAGPIDVRVGGGLAGAARVASAGGPVSLAAVQGARFTRLVVDSGGGDVDVSLDTGMGGGGGGGHGRGRGDGQGQGQQQRFASVRVVAAGGGAPSVDPALGLVVPSPPGAVSLEGRVPVSGGDGGGHLVIDAGAKGRVTLRARSWMDGVMAAARARRERGAGSGGGGGGDGA